MYYPRSENKGVDQLRVDQIYGFLMRRLDTGKIIVCLCHFIVDV